MVNSKVVLVTGASSGFGQQIALTLAASDHQVFGTSRNPPAELKESKSPIRMIQLDVTADASVQKCIERVLKETPGIDVLINNAGAGLAGAVEDCEIDEVQWQMDTNFFGAVRMIRHVLPLMRQRGSGRIITIGSMAGHVGLPYQGVYSASKHALEAINEALRLELRGSGIDATIVCPGDFKTGFTSARVLAGNASSETHAEQLKITLGIYQSDERKGPPPEEVAHLVKRLVEARSLRVRYFTGRLDQRIGVVLKRLLPARLFEGILRFIYQMP